MANDFPPEQPPGHWTHRFEVEPRFSDGLAEIVPDAVRRIGFLERGIKHWLDRALVLWRSDPEGPHSLWIEGRAGMLLTEPGLLGVPECMVAFQFDPTGGSRTVTLTFVRLVPPLEEVEDYSGDP